MIRSVTCQWAPQAGWKPMKPLPSSSLPCKEYSTNAPEVVPPKSVSYDVDVLDHYESSRAFVARTAA